MPDGEVARRTGRSLNGMGSKRERLHIPNPALRLRPWTPGEDQAERTLPPTEAVRATGRML